jgi:hypothetical protein
MRGRPAAARAHSWGPLGARRARVCYGQPQVASCRKVRSGVSCRTRRRRLPAVAHVGASAPTPVTLSAPSAESCWRFKHWTPRRASHSGVVAPDAAMPWCVRVFQRAARSTPKHVTSNRVFVNRADKGGGVSARFAITHAPHQRVPRYRKRYSTCLRVYHALRAPAPPRRAGWLRVVR